MSGTLELDPGAFERVLLAGLLASVACGVLGTFVVAKRIASISGGIAHAAFGGVGLAYLVGFSPMLGAAGSGVLAGLLVGLGHRRLGSGLDTLVSMVWAIGMALGLVFMALTPGVETDPESYLFGSLPLVSWDYVLLVAGLDALILAVVWALFKELQAVAFDEEFSEVAGVPVERTLLLLLALVALGIVVLIRVVGVILVIALLTLPAATARHWADDLRLAMGLAVLASGVCTAGGLLLSNLLSGYLAVTIPTGPVVVLVATVLYAASAIVAALLRRHSRSGRVAAGPLSGTAP